MHNLTNVMQSIPIPNAMVHITIRSGAQVLEKDRNNTVLNFFLSCTTVHVHKTELQYMFGADIGSLNSHFSVDMKSLILHEAQSSHRRQKMITLCISVLSFRNLAARGANVSSTLTTQYDMLALSGDKAIIEGSITTRLVSTGYCHCSF